MHSLDTRCSDKVFRVRADDGELFDDALEFHVIELPRVDVPLSEIRTPLQQWCFFLNNGGDLDPDEWPARLDVPEIRQAVEILVMLSQDERERQQAIDRNHVRLMENYERDRHKIHHNIGYEEGMEKGIEKGMEKGIEKGMEKGIEKGMEKGIEKGMEKGIEKGMEKGIEKGIEKGMLAGQVRILQSLLRQPQTPTGELAALPVDELARRVEVLRHQFAPAGPG